MLSTATIEQFLHQLERIATALERISATPDHQVANPEPTVAPEAAQVAEPTAEPVKAEQPEENKPSVTIDQIRKMVVTLSAKGKENKDAVREIIMAYAAKVSEIPADKYTEVMDRLTALQEG